MHDSLEERVGVAEIVEQWYNCIMEVGSDLVLPGQHPNPQTYLAADSYYQCSDARNFLLQKKQKFTMSCSKERVKVEVLRVHKDHPNNVPGDTRTIYNDETNELFTYHWDTQKGVGEKYNLSYGLVVETRKDPVKDNKDSIPGYCYYQQFFEYCDSFNAKLCERHWPHKRGGRGVPGDIGAHHDFIMASILQNTFTAYLAIANVNPDAISYETLAIDLALRLYYEVVTTEEDYIYI